MPHVASLPDHLYGTYARYKQETDEFTTWLVRNAEKARLARGLPCEIQVNKKIRVDAFVALAEEIAGHPDPQYYVPTPIVELIRSILASRIKCMRWYEINATTSSDHCQNASHGHFIEVLQYILEILKPLQRKAPLSNQNSKRTTRSSKSRSPPAKIIHQLSEPQEVVATNVESNLHEEITDQSLLTETYLMPLPDEKETTNADQQGLGNEAKELSELEQDDNTIVFEVEMDPVSEDPDDFRFKTICLLQDFSEIRSFLKMLWLQYREGDLTLIKAAQTTNVAFEVSLQIEKAFCDSVKSGTDYQQLFVEDLFQFACEEAGFSLPSIISRISQLQVLPHQHLESTSNSIYLRPWINLQNIFKEFKEMSDSLQKKSNGIDQTFAKPTFSTTVKRKWPQGFDDHTRRVQYMEDYDIVKELCEAATYSLAVPSAELGWDQLSLNLASILSKDNTEMAEGMLGSIWIGFATQVMVEIQGILRNHGLTKAVLELVKLCRDARTTILENIAFVEKHVPKEVWTASMVQRLREDLVVIDQMKQAVCSDTHKYLLARNPVMVGLVCLGIRLLLQNSGSLTLNLTSCPLDAAHVYNALKQEKFSTTTWPEMETLISLYSPEYLYGGSIPTQPCEYFPRWMMTSAYSTAKTFKRSAQLRRRFGGPNRLALSVFLLRMNSAMSHEFYRGLADKFQLLAGLFSTEAYKSGRSRLPQNPQGKIDFPKLRKQQKNLPLAKPIDLLNHFATAFEQEQPELYFNYVRFANRCMELDLRFSQAMSCQLAQMSVKSQMIGMNLGTRMSRALLDLMVLAEIPFTAKNKDMHDAAQTPLKMFASILEDLLQKWKMAKS